VKIQETLSPMGLLLASCLIAAYSIETCIASGWISFIRNSLSSSSATSHNDGAKASVGHNPGGVQELIDHRLHCDKLTRHQLSNREGSPPRLSIWFSPYRQFPEILPEGDHRGKGDYEYLSYAINAKCRVVASNYGAFRGSLADRVFSEASDQGLRQELLLARKLGYNLFALDLKKVWLSKGDAGLCEENHSICTETSDGFLVFDLKGLDGMTQQADFLRHSLRMGVAQTLATSLEAISISGVRSGHWYDWEYPSPGSALRWSNGILEKTPRADVLTPLVGESIPKNLRISLFANVSLKRLVAEAVCTRGDNSTIQLVVHGSTDVTREFSICMPRYLRVISALVRDGASNPQLAPRITEQDQRRSYYAIQYSLKGAAL
jgi:hypothetical protein